MKLTRTRCQLATSNQQLATDLGFTLIELLIVMSIILIIMAFAVPNVLKMTKNAHQTSAIQSLRVINGVEKQYNSTYPTNGYGCPIAVLGGDPKAAPTPEAAGLIDPTLASTGIKAGYVFTITCGSKTTSNNQDTFNSYELTAVPQSVGHTGDDGYCTDESGIIKVDHAGGTNCTQPLQ